VAPFTHLLAVKRGHSIVGVFSRRADAAVVTVLRKWWTAGHSLLDRIEGRR
jgi:hypothetical protein